MCSTVQLGDVARHTVPGAPHVPSAVALIVTEPVDVRVFVSGIVQFLKPLQALFFTPPDVTLEKQLTSVAFWARPLNPDIVAA
jgi:hypothetical protein